MAVEGLFERARELAELEGKLAAATAGDGSLVLVEGPAGIGKSRLLAEFRRRARGAATVLSARGSDLERDFAFGVVRQLFEAELADPQLRGRLLCGAAGPAAAAFGDLALDAEGAGFATLHGLYWLVLNLAEDATVVISVDDLQWCDRPSLRFLEYLARRLEGQPVLLVAGVRDGEPGVDPLLLDALRHDPSVATIRPGPLTADALGRIIADELGTPPDEVFLQTCLDATGGSPLLLTQLLPALRSEAVTPDAGNADRVRQIGPRAVSRTVLLRLRRLDAAATAVAEAVALLNDGADLAAVARLAGVSEAEAAEAARALAGAEILGDELPLAFVHPLVRDAVYHVLAPADRARQHARAAEILRDLGAPDERVAAQLLLAPPAGRRWVVDLLRVTGAAALRAGAPESAAAYLRRALEEVPDAPDRGRQLLEIGRAESRTSGRDPVPHLREAYALLTDPVDRAATAELLGRLMLFTTSAEETAAFARQAIADLPADLVDHRRALTAFEYMTGYFGGGDLRRLAELAQYRDLDVDQAGARQLVAMAAWQAVCGDGTAEQAATLALRALAGPQLRTTDPNLIWFAAANALQFCDRPEALAIFELALADAHRHGSLFTIAAVNMWFGHAKYNHGDLAAAEELLRASIEGFTVWGYNNQAVVTARCFLSSLLHARGEVDEAVAMVDELGDTDPGENTTGWWASARASVLLAVDRAEEVLPLTDLMAQREAVGADSSRLWRRALRAAALHRLGRREEALAMAEEDVAVTRAFGAPVHLGRSLRVLGRMLGGPDGLAHLAEAATVLEASTHKLEFARALEAYGAALRRAGQVARAREPLLRALELASACGVEPMAVRVRAELQAAGVRPRRDAISGMGSLTPSERRVVELAATGRANRDIAQDLFVTPKTVEVHLSSAYRKLGIRSRGELGPVLAAAG